MKRFIALTVLLFSITLFLYHGTSFSYAEIKNDTIITIVPEEHALIAISYGKGGNFFITNNTSKAIDVTKVEVVNEPGQAVISIVEKSPFTINPGGSQKLTIKGDPKILTGRVIQLTARWNGGSAKINSIIPKLIGKNAAEESNEANTDSEPTGEDVDNINQEPIEKENLIPKSKKEEDGSEEDTAIIESEVKDEITEPDADEAIIEPEIDEEK